MRPKFPILFLLLIAPFFAGCPAQKSRPAPDPEREFSPRKEEELVIESSPSGARVSFSTGGACNTPCRTIKSREQDITVRIEKDGYVGVNKVVKSLPLLSPEKSASLGASGQAVAAAGIRYLSPNPLVVKLVPAWTKD